MLVMSGGIVLNFCSSGGSLLVVVGLVGIVMVFFIWNLLFLCY